MRLRADPVYASEGQCDVSGTAGDESLDDELQKSPAAALPVSKVRGAPTTVSDSARFGRRHAPVAAPASRASK